MSDLEEQLRAGLSRAADQAPGDRGLADLARRRARERTERRAALGVVGALVVLLVPVGFLLTERDGGSLVTDRQGAPDPRDSGRAAPDGWREEQWQGVSVLVPDDWQQGSRSAWCAGGGSAGQELVERPGQPGAGVACADPEQSLGVTFGSADAFGAAYPSGHVWRYTGGDVEVYAEGTWLGYWYDRDHVVQVNAADRRTVERVLASVAEVGDGWSTVAVDGITLDLPPGWGRLDASGCEFAFTRFGPTDADPCEPAEAVVLYGSSTFDPAYRPGLRRAEEGEGWAGYVYAGEWAVYVEAQDRATAQRVLDSAR